MPLNVQSTDSPWEAFRLTSKSPSELYDVLGPNGIDALVRHALLDCWNGLPAGTRSLATWSKCVDEVWSRNMSIWSRIKKPSPAAFFENMRPDPADGHLRQALIMTWMMLPRGRRDMRDVRAVITHIFQRQRSAWEEDEQTLKRGPARRKSLASKRSNKKKPAPRPTSRPAKSSRKKTGRR
jgi:hypothetical protein